MPRKSGIDTVQWTIPSDTTTNETIGIGETVSGFLHQGDEDWYAIELLAGQTIQIDLIGNDPDPSSGPVDLPDPYLRVYNASGAYITGDDDGGGNLDSRLIFTAGSTGTYYLEADSYSGGDRGLYDLTVTDLNSDIGGPGPDILYGTNGADTMSGNGGNDEVHGLDGDDTINGGSGNDLLVGGDGADVMAGNNGLDELRGGDGNDTMHGGGANDLLMGGNGLDTLNGGTFNDRLFGEDGNDRIRGGAGEDRIIGGAGSDFTYGGSGADHFIFQSASDSAAGSGVDRIFDFVIGEDAIDLSGVIGAEFDFVGTSVFSGNGPEVRLNELAGGSTVVQADIDGDSVADMQIFVSGVTGLSDSDFVL